MADGNGHATDGMALPRRCVTFVIGGENISVPGIRFLDLDESEGLDLHLNALSPNISSREYVNHVLQIVAHQVAESRPDLTYDVLRSRLLAGEAGRVIATMNDLLSASGFILPEPVPPVPENLGTGTSTGSAPDSPPEESAADTPSS